MWFYMKINQSVNMVVVENWCEQTDLNILIDEEEILVSVEFCYFVKL